MIKEQIISTALELFSQYGIKSVSMDDIARSMSISKRTLYSHFDDKEALLLEALTRRNRHMIEFMKQLERENHTTIDTIMLFHDELLKRPVWFSKKFYEDMKKYPKAMQQLEDERAFFTPKCLQIFQQGIKEGVFQSEVNLEIVTLLAKEQLKMRHPSKTFSNHSNSEIFTTVLITFLRGISTDKGREILDTWIRKRRLHSIQ